MPANKPTPPRGGMKSPTGTGRTKTAEPKKTTTKTAPKQSTKEPTKTTAKPAAPKQSGARNQGPTTRQSAPKGMEGPRGQAPKQSTSRGQGGSAPRQGAPKGMEGTRGQAPRQSAPKGQGGPAPRQSAPRQEPKPEPRPMEQVRMKVNPEGRMEFYDLHGRPIFDEGFIRRVKQDPMYRPEEDRLMRDFIRANEMEMKRLNDANYALINIAAYAYAVKSMKDFEALRDSVVLDQYHGTRYGVAKPTEDSVYDLLIEESKESINGWKLWEVVAKRKEYAQARLQDRLEEELEKWEADKAAYNEKEAKRKEKYEAKALEEYNTKIQYYDELMNGNEEYISYAVDETLKNQKLPLKFTYGYKIFDGDTAFVDVGLPDIDALPADVAEMNASGVLKMKSKTAGELNDDYIDAVLGGAMYYMSAFFDASPAIKTVVVSGYRPGRDSRGEAYSEYIYSIVFDRKGVQGKNLTNKNPYDFCMSFSNRINILQSGKFKEIEPYAPEEL